MASPLATVGILSIGDMGLGIAKLLAANDFRVVTNVTGRSHATQARAESASVQLLPTDEDLVATADYILSIVPPRDALATANRIFSASKSTSFAKREKPLYYLDLNAISPNSAREIATLFRPLMDDGKLHFLDGGIIGGPPSPKPNAGETLNKADSWQRPSIPISGPHPLFSTPTGETLSSLLNISHISSSIGPASGLKLCFASLTKGLTALAIQSFTAAHRLDVLPELKRHLQTYSPKTFDLVERGVVNMPPKAYRWVREMEEIRDCFEVDGGFESENVFGGVAGVYGFVADGTELGLEKTGKRVRGKNVEDVARLVSEGVERRKIKTE